MNRFLYAAIGQRDPHRQGIDKHAQNSVGTRASLQATQQHGAKDHIVAAAGLCQHLPPSDMEQHAWTDSQTAGLSADSLCQIGGEQETGFGDGFTVALHFEHTKWRSRFVDISELGAEVGLMHRVRHAQGLGDKVAVGQRGGQCLGMPLQQQGNLGKDKCQRHLVADQMMETQGQQPFILCRIVGNVGGKQWRAVQVETVLVWISMSP